MQPHAAGSKSPRFAGAALLYAQVAPRLLSKPGAERAERGAERPREPRFPRPLGCRDQPTAQGRIRSSLPLALIFRAVRASRRNSRNVRRQRLRSVSP